ncbi:MAG: hypothetical protein HY023_15230 [Chloroflexi bacterium]|nr:hypothetical protein [Chloroflexota bacterium]MBI3762949.1 hypothetical protein [Chloroflexota bacterium]
MSEFHRDAMMPEEEAPCPVDHPTPRLPDFERPPDPRLVAEGWLRRFMADTERLSEYVELYASLGLDVRTEKVSPEEVADECSDCRLIICRQFVTIYTRQRQG